MLLTAVWNVLFKLVPYDPSSFVAHKFASSSKEVSLEEGMRLLKVQGFIVNIVSVAPLARSFSTTKTEF